MPKVGAFASGALGFAFFTLRLRADAGRFGFEVGMGWEREVVLTCTCTSNEPSVLTITSQSPFAYDWLLISHIIYNSLGTMLKLRYIYG